MIQAGDVIENPVTGERLVFHKTSRETNGEAVVLETFVKPDGFVAAAHVHPHQEERFQILRGTVGFRLGRKKIVRIRCDLRSSRGTTSTTSVSRSRLCGCSGWALRSVRQSAGCWATRQRMPRPARRRSPRTSSDARQQARGAPLPGRGLPRAPRDRGGRLGGSAVHGDGHVGPGPSKRVLDAGLRRRPQAPLRLSG
jgi:hypothetical protein